MTVATPLLDGRIATPTRRSTFGDAVRSEWAKLTTVRSTWITLLVSVLLGVGVGTLISYLRGSHYASDFVGPKGGIGSGWDPAGISLRGLMIAQLAFAVLGTLTITSEYGTGMIRTSLTAVPKRNRLLLSKALVFTAVALVVGEVISFAAFIFGQLAIGANAPNTSLGAHDVLRAVIGAGLYLAVIGLLGCLVGAIVRSTAAGISAMVALLFVLPGLVQALPTSWANALTKWWPTEAGSQVFAVQRDAHTLTAWPGFAVLLVFTAVVLAIALWIIERRDA